MVFKLTYCMIPVFVIEDRSMHSWFKRLSFPILAFISYRTSSGFLPRKAHISPILANLNSFRMNSAVQRPNYYSNNNMHVLNHLAQLCYADQVLVVLCGIPGSGKSTYAKRLVGGLPPPYRSRWVVANQDKLGTRINVMKVVRAALHAKRSVIVDRCNFNAEQRSHWIEVAQEFNVSATFAVTMPHHINTALCIERAFARGNSDGHGEDVNWKAVCIGMQREYTAPDVREGFAGIFGCSDDSDLTCFANSVADIGLRQLEHSIPQHDQVSLPDL